MLRPSIISPFIVVTLIGLIGCSGGSSKGTQGGSQNPGDLQATVLPGPAGEVPVMRKSVADPIVVRECLLTVISKQDAPSERDGVIRKIFVKVGDKVQEGQLLAQLDDRLAAADCEIKRAKITSSEAKQEAAKKTKEVAMKQVIVTKSLIRTGAEKTEKLDLDQLTVDRYAAEEVSEQQNVRLAKEELKQSEIVQEMHKIHSSIAGEIKQILKQPGETVKNLETVFVIQGFEKLRVEGLAEIKYLHRLRSGKKLRAVIEHSISVAPELPLIGHLNEVTSVAVSKDADNPLIVSASLDKTVMVWDRKRQRDAMVLPHPSPVRAVACTGPEAAANLCLSGSEDGKARLWDLDSHATQPLRELQEKHKGAVTCVAFSPDGKSCVTGGDDKEICLWDTATGALRIRFPAVHRGAITSLQFPQPNEVISASRDSTLAMWRVGEQAQLVRHIPSRSGDVTVLGASPDGKRVLFDQGKTLRVLSLPDGRTEAELQNASGGSSFSTFALFSPDGRTILTAGSSGGRLQLWRTPDRHIRGFEIRQLDSTEKSTCSAFAPNGAFLVTGTRDRRVLVWPAPTAKEDIDRLLTAEITLVEGDVQTAGKQVRIWAELDNPQIKLPNGRTGSLLVTGTTVTMVIYDE